MDKAKRTPKTTIKVPRAQIEQTIRKNVANGQFFGCRFIKRSTGETREMNARLGVKKHLKGGEPRYDPKEHNLLVVFDQQKGAYRSIPLENVLEINTKGVTIVPED
jgi:hypothetical protein